MKNPIHGLLNSMEQRAVLVDIGASGSTPSIWDPIAPQSIYVGFDADSRRFDETLSAKYYKSMVVNAAVVAGNGRENVKFYFTRSPYCSGTLPPDTAALSNYVFSDLFDVEHEQEVPADQLDSVMRRFSLDRVDWLKIDSQGTDLRLFNSLREEIRSRVLALDIEPGLINAYQGEDLFIDAHRELVQNGFWLSNLRIGETARIRKQTRRNLSSACPDLSDAVLTRSLRPSPAWCETRYLRTLDWLATSDAQGRDYLLLWVFCLLDNQLGFALELTEEGSRRFPHHAEWNSLKKYVVAQIRGAAKRRDSVSTRMKALLR